MENWRPDVFPNHINIVFRSEEEFSVEGTGNRISFQNGPTNSDLQQIPLIMEEVDESVR